MWPAACDSQTGSNVEAPLVVATCDPKQALLALLGPGLLPLAVEAQMGCVRMRGTSAKVNLALDGLLVFRGREGDRHARAVVADHVDASSAPSTPPSIGAAPSGLIST